MMWKGSKENLLVLLLLEPNFVAPLEPRPTPSKRGSRPTALPLLPPHHNLQTTQATSRQDECMLIVLHLCYRQMNPTCFQCFNIFLASSPSIALAPRNAALLSRATVVSIFGPPSPPSPRQMSSNALPLI